MSDGGGVKHEGIKPPGVYNLLISAGVKKVYGCSLSGQEREGAESGDASYPRAAEGFLFAPTDVTPWEAVGKDDMHGIGYRGMQEQNVLGARKATKALYGMSGEVCVYVHVCYIRTQ